MVRGGRQTAWTLLCVCVMVKLDLKQSAVCSEISENQRGGSLPAESILESVEEGLAPPTSFSGINEVINAEACKHSAADLTVTPLSPALGPDLPSDPLNHFHPSASIITQQLQNSTTGDQSGAAGWRSAQGWQTLRVQ